MYHFYSLNRDEFGKHYHQRSNAESCFSMVKAKFRDNVRSTSDIAMKNEVLCKFLAHNLCCVIQSQLELGIAADFWGDTPTAALVEPESVITTVPIPVMKEAVRPTVNRMMMCGA